MFNFADITDLYNLILPFFVFGMLFISFFYVVGIIIGFLYRLIKNN